MTRAVDPAVIEAVFADDGPLAAAWPGYRARRAQVDMAKAVGRALSTTRGRLVVEAGTGTGKSLAYLVPLLLSGRRAVVATATKALQDQLADKDAPRAIAAVTAALAARGEAPATPLRAVRLKGRSNYLCLQRFELWDRQRGFELDDDASAAAAALRDFASRTTTGDRAELAGLPETLPIWAQLDCAKDTCLGTSCARYDDCFLVRARRDADGAALLITNHALLCADLALRQEQSSAEFSFGVLPAYDAVVVDEAHALPDAATDHFGASVSLADLARLTADVRRQAQRSGPQEARRLLQQCQVTDDDARAFFAALPAPAITAKTPPSEARGGGRVVFAPSDALAAPQRALDRALIDLATACDAARAAFDQGGADDTLERAALAGLKARGERLRAALVFTTTVAPRDAGYVCVIDKSARDAALIAAPVHVADVLQSSLFGDESPVVLTSATLAVGADLGAFVAAVGLAPVPDVPVPEPSDSDDNEGDEGVGDDNGSGDGGGGGDGGDDVFGDASALPPAQLETVVFASPFDHPRRAALYAPTDMPLPDAPTYQARFDDELLFLLGLSRGGALVLFTSHRALEGAVRRLRPALTTLTIPLLKQGERPKAALLDELRTHGSAALFATASFWEGIDVPGAALRLVVIDRLPFRVPTDPLVRARADAATRRGKDAFTDLAVPEAALALKQGAGRLLRGPDDAGVVAVLDGRLRQKRYGQAFLAALPPMTRVGSRATVTQFWQRHVVPTLGLPSVAIGAPEP